MGCEQFWANLGLCYFHTLQSGWDNQLWINTEGYEVDPCYWEEMTTLGNFGYKVGQEKSDLATILATL